MAQRVRARAIIESGYRGPERSSLNVFAQHVALAEATVELEAILIAVAAMIVATIRTKRVLRANRELLRELRSQRR